MHRTMMERPEVQRPASRPSRPPTAAGSASVLLGLQRTAGNRAVAALLATPGHGRRPSSAINPVAPPSGSTALDSDERDGPIGAGHLPIGAPDAGVRDAGAPDSGARDGGSADAGAPAPLTIKSTTAKAAPSGAPSSRTEVGVGEVVTFTANTAGTWAASAGTPPASPAAAGTFAWTAPATAQSVNITVTALRQTATMAMTVVAPASISMRNVGSHGSLVGAGGACMLTEVKFNPTTVCLGAIQWLEVPGPATSIDGFFKKFSAATLKHNPNANFAIVNDSNIMEAGPNNGPNDHCAWHSLPGPYKAGTFTWVIPNKYIIDGEATGSGRHFFDTAQVFTMTAAGALSITKAGAST